jgi:hypothetical protein
MTLHTRIYFTLKGDYLEHERQTMKRLTFELKWRDATPFSSLSTNLWIMAGVPSSQTLESQPYGTNMGKTNNNYDECLASLMKMLH